ncbi:MAG: S-adenosyl-l-methionine hydroxide adenosyltransferase family protein [Solirubrobacteraceae bacterium]
MSVPVAAPLATPVLTLLTDYGLDDGYAGVCHGVIAGICPAARVIDVSHRIPRQDVRAGAVVLAAAIAYLPRGVHIAVVDPGVGSDRRALAVQTADGRLFVGPDNGLLWPAMQACGGATEAVEVSESPLRLASVSATFHGRDIFAPVAAHLAAGVELSAAGSPLDPGALVTLELPRARLENGALLARVMHIDTFGNVVLGATERDLECLGAALGQRLELAPEPHVGGAGPVNAAVLTARCVRTFADARGDELVVYLDSNGAVAIAINGASAAGRLVVASGGLVRISPL